MLSKSYNKHSESTKGYIIASIQFNSMCMKEKKQDYNGLFKCKHRGLLAPL